MTSATSTSPASTICRSLPVVAPKGTDPASFTVGSEAFIEKEGDNTVLINSDFLDGMSVPAAKAEIAEAHGGDGHRRAHA